MTKHSVPFKGLIVSVAVFALIAIAMAVLFGQIDARGQAERAERVRRAIRQAAVVCYAVEGYYPSSVAYLKENYGVTYDENAYIVRYDAFASNIMPDIGVLTKGDALA